MKSDTGPFNRDVGDGSINDSIIRTLTLTPLVPKQFFAENITDGVQVRAVGRDRLLERDGAVKYRVRWVEDGDMTTETGRKAARVRSVIVCTLDAPGHDGVEVTDTIRNATYGNGYLLCEAVGISQNVSDDFLFSQRLDSDVLDSTIPGDVTHFQASESGEEHQSSMVSVLSVECQAPSPIGSFDRVQLYYKDYPQIGGMNEGESHRYSGGSGGSIQFQAMNASSRRKGEGTVSLANGNSTVTGTGGSFLSQAQPGDVIEVLGRQATVSFVTSNDSLTLTAVWAGPSVTSLADFTFIGLITVFAVAVSKAGTRRTDIENAPSVKVLFDAEDSAPNTPTMTGAALGNMNRLDVTPLVGTRVDHYNFYRGLGPAQPFSACTFLHAAPHDPTNVAGSIQFDDTDFTIYQREHAQVFSYYATAVNIARQEGLPSTIVELTCRLAAPSDGGVQIPGQTYSKNLLWNGMCYLNANVIIDPTDVNQDTSMGGGVPPGGFSRWNHEEGGGAISIASFQNTTELILPHNGSGGAYTSAKQWVGAWNNLVNANRRIPIGCYVTFQCLARTSGGTPDGILGVDISQQDSAFTHQGWAKYRQRLNTDVMDESATGLNINPGDLVVPWQKYWATFHLDPALTTAFISLRIRYQDGTTPANIVLSQIMLSIGDALPQWTGELVDPLISYQPPGGGAPLPPGGFPDQDGGRGPRLNQAP